MALNPFDDRRANVKAKVATTYVFIVAANIVAWTWAWTAFSERPGLMGAAVLAFMFGLRHAFDADHIAAIDNVVRKLMQDGKTPYSVGFFFSLGHSSFVALASIMMAAAAVAMQGQAHDFQALGGAIGTVASASFLIVIGLANLLVLSGVWSAYNRARRGEPVLEEDLDRLLNGRGFFTRVLRPLFRFVSRSPHMYVVGFLFGLGFDTATEIGLLGISAGQAAQDMSFSTTLVFPALFTAGMSLLDTTDSVVMTGAYGWAFDDPLRKLWYNLVMTAMSVIVAIFIGGVEALGLIGDKLGFEGGIWGVVQSLNGNLANFGIAIAAILIASWIISSLVYRTKGPTAAYPRRSHDELAVAARGVVNSKIPGMSAFLPIRKKERVASLPFNSTIPPSKNT
ncbi:HoxN/HupN/NixA family nickel/cobalt transporter [Methylocystis sp.]|uniref:HoxN/HupN/NixA family nickel/cobalt transporter n=1 Tax=Methylocystis sp. TaxID=1911079 RepID=UPI0025E287ED|nr:HoxN/HupN/NixA family nickel/cobalt transporter [Methylocystis sp.]